MAARSNDILISELLSSGRLVVDPLTGNVFAPRSNTPSKPLGAATAKGYLRTSVYVSGKSVTLLVHRIVWIAANGMLADSSLHINHKNGCKVDNRLSNLEAVTHVENMAHSRQLGLHKGCGRKDARRDSLGRFGKEWDEFPEVAR